MERVDKVISNQTGYSRKEVKEMIKNKRVQVNGTLIHKGEEKIDIEKDVLLLDNKPLKIQKNVYLLLNKPKGYVSATEDKKDRTVLELVPIEYSHRSLFPAGRLDKDTTGLMLITDDGDFAHEILSPKKHIKKIYRVTIDSPLTDEMIQGFQTGVHLQEGVCEPAQLEIESTYQGVVTLTEGKYHQIKRMFSKYHANVIELERIAMGQLWLPNDLEYGMIRECSPEELQKIAIRE